MKEVLKRIYSNHEELRINSINLLPSESQSSPLAQAFLEGDMGNRYFFSNPYSKESIKYSYYGTEYIKEIVDLGHTIAQDVFKSKYVSFYPISGHNANLTLLFRHCKYNDNIVVYDPACGGYPGLDRNKLPKYLGLNTFYFPVLENTPELVDIEKSVSLIRKIKPKIIIYSQAHTLFPVPLKELISISKEVGSIFVYDASHPLGLIAGGIFQDPLSDGSDYLVGGTQKSLPGPQGGIILSNKENIEQYEHFITVDNPHFNRIASTIVTLAEMKEFGREYAENVVINTRYLASKLFDKGFNVLYPEKNFTESHMFKMKVDNDYLNFIDKLNHAHIFLDSSGRIGCAEMTRFGMMKSDFDFIAELFIKILHSNNPQKYQNDVQSFRSKFTTIKYGYDVK